VRVDTFPSIVAGGENLRYRVYVPPCYQESGRRYPYLILLHGAASREDQWENLGVTLAADQGFTLGVLPPMIIVTRMSSASSGGTALSSPVTSIWCRPPSTRRNSPPIPPCCPRLAYVCIWIMGLMIRQAAPSKHSRPNSRAVQCRISMSSTRPAAMMMLTGLHMCPSIWRSTGEHGPAMQQNCPLARNQAHRG